jgi:hypothetical protein
MRNNRDVIGGIEPFYLVTSLHHMSAASDAHKNLSPAI